MAAKFALSVISSLLAYYTIRLALTDCDLALSSSSSSVVANAFKNKRVWITGASSGIGKQLSLSIAKLGGTVLLSARSQEGLMKVKTEIEAFGGKCHILVLDLEDLKSLPGKVDTAKNILGADVDILINNGGVSQRSFAKDTKLQTDFTILNVDYVSAVILTKSLLEGWLKREDKSDSKGIINISSLAGKIGFPLRTSYCAAKFALLGFMDALRLESSMNGNIIVSNICPGSVSTDVSKNALRGDGRQFGTTDSNILNGMKVERCVDLILLAYANKIEEVWLFGNAQEKVFAYLAQYFPSLFRTIVRNNNRKLLEHATNVLAEGMKAE